MKKIAFLFLGVMYASILLSQSQKARVSIAVVNEEKRGIENATVELLTDKDSLLVKTALSDKNGLAEFDNIKFGQYLIRVSFVGYASGFSQVFTLTESTSVLVLPSLSLSVKTGSQLENVTITAKKPFIQKLSDRIVVNVESSILNSGSFAIEVLERSPGITIDQNDVISLRGKAGVIVMIDGKPSAMTGSDLANYLRGLPSNAIERIDIITNPSAKYDAAGNSGIIDIRMKKDQKLGANGTLTAGYGQGLYPKANAGATFNYRNKAVNVFGNYNYAYRKMLNHLVINRNFFTNGNFVGSDDKDNYATMPFHSNTARIGADFFPSKNTIVGFVVNGTFNKFRRHADIETTVNDEQNQSDYQFFSVGTNDDHFENIVANVNIKQKLDSTGKELNADLDYGVFNSKSLTRTSSAFYEMNGTPKSDDEILDGDQTGKLHFKTAKIDFVDPLKKGAKLEAGFKASYVNTDNDAKFYNVFPTYTKIDSGKTNHFYYQEYNFAGYLNYNREFKKFNYQLGLRGENTVTKTKQEQGNRQNKNNYFKLFPSAFFNYKIREEKTIGLSVSRRIDRPGYSQLNPFLFQIDPTIYGTGNTMLKAQMTWSYELSYTMKNFNFTAGYSRTTDAQNVVLVRIRDVFPDFVIQPGQSENITVQIPVNLSSQDYYGITATTPLRINNWWNMVNNLNFYYNKFNGSLGGVALNDGAPAANIRTNNSFSFKKGWSAELNANLNTGGRSGYMVMEPQWGVAIGGQKTIFNGKGTVRLNITDIFWTNLPKAQVVYEGRYVENWHAYRETRVGTCTFTYRFGNNKVQQSRRRTTASEEERQRAS